jgi:hypothetical protein
MSFNSAKWMPISVVVFATLFAVAFFDKQECGNSESEMERTNRCELYYVSTPVQVQLYWPARE